MIWYPDTCNCAVDVENKVIVVRCKSHNTFLQVKTHNNNLDDSKGFTAIDRDNEKNKLEFGLNVSETNKMKKLKELLNVKSQILRSEL